MWHQSWDTDQVAEPVAVTLRSSAYRSVVVGSGGVAEALGAVADVSSFNVVAPGQGVTPGRGQAVERCAWADEVGSG
jgi:hypothetical protein